VDFDIAIIGGGINGCGIARDAAGRGLRVLLVEQGDLGGATSSASTKLIHGGLRYLEHYDFRLVHESLQEREVLSRLAPHNIRPLRFVLPHHAGLRPRWMLRAGLALYDLLGAAKLSPARSLNLRADEAGAPLQARYAHGFSYSDCWTDDARLVVLNAIDAAARGADVRVCTKLTAARREGDHWRLVLSDGTEVNARTIVNAGGAWVNEVLRICNVQPRAGARLVQGSHIIVPKLFARDNAYIFQQSDGRIVFAIPYEHDFTLIGTTDQDFKADPTHPKASATEIAYLCAAANEYFTQQISPEDVVSTYSGVRALYDDGAGAAKDVTRDYVLSLDAEGPAMLSLYGGKITTYRRLAEAALLKLAPYLPEANAPWTKTASLPGGDFERGAVNTLAERLREAHAFLDERWALRLARAYGTRALTLFTGEPGEMFGGELSAREVDYLVTQEWARTAEDVLWRRTKLGLRANPSEVARLEVYMRKTLEGKRAAPTPASDLI
jgi:glycerol-3-phosphate dehydrogenase